MKIDAIYIALDGYLDNVERVGLAAEKIAKNAPFGDLPRDIVDLKVGQRGAEASLKAAKVADEMIGSLLDVLA